MPCGALDTEEAFVPRIGRALEAATISHCLCRVAELGGQQDQVP